MDAGDAGDAGFFKVHRQILDSDVFDDPWILKVFLWCLAKARWQPAKRDGDPDVGQFLTSKRRAALELKTDESKAYRGLERLRALGCISLETTNKRTIVTVINFSAYQNDETDEVRAEPRDSSEPPKVQKVNRRKSPQEPDNNTTCEDATRKSEPPVSAKVNHESTTILIREELKKEESGTTPMNNTNQPDAATPNNDHQDAHTGQDGAANGTQNGDVTTEDNLSPEGLQMEWYAKMQGRRPSAWEKPAERFALMIELGIPAYEIRREIRLPHGDVPGKKRHRAEQLEKMCQRIEARHGIGKTGGGKKKTGFADGVRDVGEWAED